MNRLFPSRCTAAASGPVRRHVVASPRPALGCRMPGRSGVAARTSSGPSASGLVVITIWHTESWIKNLDRGATP